MNEILLEAVNEVLEGKMQPKLTSLDEHAHLRNDIGFTSFDLAELTVRLEEKTDIDIFSNGLVNTVSDILKVLNENKK